MRARMAIAASGVCVELREVVLRDKPAEMLAVSHKGTVPVLVLPDGRIIDESLDMMHWALVQKDPVGWLNGDERETAALIADNDGPFKHHLDRFKYATRYQGEDTPNDPIEHRSLAEPYLLALNARLASTAHLFGDQPTLADIAIFPFVRQFAAAAGDWMQDARFAALNAWLNNHVESPLFKSIMKKLPQWQAGTVGIEFPWETST
jgi:glutathione S-transferase